MEETYYQMLNGEQKMKNGNTLVSGITTYVVTVGDNLNQTEVGVIASDPDSKYVIPVTDFAAMNDVVDQIAQATCEESGES